MQYRWMIVVALCAACERAVVAPAPAGSGCVTHLMIGGGKITYDHAGAMYSVPYREGAAPDFPDAPPFDSRCAATVWADDAVPFQEVIFVMDAALVRGVGDVYFEPPDSREPVPAKRRDRKPPDKDRLVQMPVLTMSRTDVSFRGEVIAKVMDPDLQRLVAAKLPPKPADPSIILQGDRALPFGQVARAIRAMAAAGYTDVMIATKKSAAE